MEHLSQRVADVLEQNRLIDGENREIYEYGFERLFTYSLNLITTCVIGAMLGLLPESLAFSVAFILMRHYNGGAHAANNVRCYILSTISVLACLFAVKWAVSIEVEPLIVFVLLIPFAMIILGLSPVEDYNKPIDATERKVYRERGIAVLSLCFGVSLVFMMLGLPSLGCGAGSAIILTSITMVIGRIKNTLIDRQLDKSE